MRCLCVCGPEKESVCTCAYDRQTDRQMYRNAADSQVTGVKDAFQEITAFVASTIKRKQPPTNTLASSTNLLQPLPRPFSCDPRDVNCLAPLCPPSVHFYSVTSGKVSRVTRNQVPSEANGIGDCIVLLVIITTGLQDIRMCNQEQRRK